MAASLLSLLQQMAPKGPPAKPETQAQRRARDLAKRYAGKCVTSQDVQRAYGCSLGSASVILRAMGGLGLAKETEVLSNARRKVWQVRKSNRKGNSWK